MCAYVVGIILISFFVQPSVSFVQWDLNNSALQELCLYICDG